MTTIKIHHLETISGRFIIALGLIPFLFIATFSTAEASTPGSISGTETFTTPSGFSSDISASSVLPSGFFYQTSLLY